MKKGKYKVGIVFVNYNSGEFLRIALDSCLRAKTKVAWEYCVVDNGSSVQEQQLAEHIVSEALELAPIHCGYFIKIENNKGFAGGNNIGIQKMLKNPSVTHICLLNTDVIVPDYWLENLLQEDADVTVPVTNGANNIQAVPIMMEPPKDILARGQINSFAAHRQKIYGKERLKASKVIFFAILLSRNAIEKVGLLDEHFFPGNFEDDDYCARLEKAEIPIWVMRGCYIHHWGSASFGKIHPKRASRQFIKNRSIFEKKWKVHWVPPLEEMVRSYYADIDFLQRNQIKDATAWMMVQQGKYNLEALMHKQTALLDTYDRGDRPIRESAANLVKALSGKLI